MSIWAQLTEEIEAFTTGISELPVQRQVVPLELRTELNRSFDFSRGIPLDQLTARVCELLRNGSTHVTHPRYFGLFNPSVRQASIVADALVALYNPQLAAWSHAPAACEIERLTLSSLAADMGFEPEAIIANFTTGGAEANLSATITALVDRVPGFAKSGLKDVPRPAIYITSESHHSFVKIARMTGLGTDSLREIRLDSRLTMDEEDLARQIEADHKNGWLPLMIVGTAGTTGAGLIDPLPRLAGVAGEHHVWFHVDAAWGGSAALSPRLKHLLAGIELADSVTWDAHKWLSVPMGAGMFFCRHPEAVRQAFAIVTSYMPGQTGDTLDPYSSTVQWSRRMIGLKVFMALAEIGKPGYAALIEHQAGMGDLLRRRLAERGWIVRNETQLPVVCFTHPDIQNGSITTAQILKTLTSRGRVWISDVVLGGKERLLRACITSFRTGEEDIRCLVDEIEHARRFQ